MKVVLATLNSKYVHTSIALYYLKNRIKDMAEVTILNLNINDPIRKNLNKILELKPEALCFGVYIWNIEETLKLSKDIKIINPKIKIAYGGPEVSYSPDELIEKYNFIDSILVTESENNIINFLQDIKIDQIKKKYQIAVNAEDIPSIADDLVDNYDGRVIYFETSRGCPFRCSYCLSCIDKSVRYFDMKQTKNDLKKLLEKNVCQIRFIDRTFNSNPKRALELWQFLLDNRKNTEFHFEICASLINDEVLAFLRKVPKGIFRFEIGIQSTNKKTLEAINRNYNFNFEKNVITELSKEGNIHLHTDLIIGLPYETIDIFKNTFNDVYSLRSNEFQIGFLKFLKGTDIYNQKEKYNYLYSDYPPYEVLQNAFISYEEISYLKKFEIVFDYVYNSKNFIESIKYLETKFKSYYELYEHITEYFIKNNLIEIKLSFDDIYLHLIDLFKRDNILIQTLTYDFMSKFKGKREWMYNKYDLKKEITEYLTYNNLPIETMKRSKFVILDYDITSMNEEKTIYMLSK